MLPVNLSLKPTKPVARKSGRGDWKPTRSRFLVKLLFTAIVISPISAFVQVLSSSSFHASRLSATSDQQLSLGIISFDLDDTLFPTNAVVNDANKVMLEKLKQYGVDVQEEEFLDITRQIRKSLDGPVTYTSLRKMTIAQIIAMGTAFTDNKRASKEECEGIVDECFDAWLHERHCAAERHLFPQTLNCLSTLQEQFPDACFAAITNGRGNPLCMPVLADFFDFCVSGEDDGVFPARKPAPGIYQASLKKYRELYPHHDQDSRIWVHVGDCLANDVGASASVGAYAVWFSDQPMKQLDSSTLKWSTATSSEQDARKLKEEEGREKVAVRISW